MSTETLKPNNIQAFTAENFIAPKAFTDFCSNGGQSLTGVIGGKHVSGSMNAVLDVINPGTKEVLATVSEMGWNDVSLAVEDAYRAYNSSWKNTSVDERASLIMKLVELYERDLDVFLAF